MNDTAQCRCPDCGMELCNSRCPGCDLGALLKARQRLAGAFPNPMTEAIALLLDIQIADYAGGLADDDGGPDEAS